MLFHNLVTVGSAFLSLLLRDSLVSANINVYNWCSFDVYAFQVVGGDCPRGQDYQCYNNPYHLDPYVMRSGSETVFSILEQPGAKIYLVKVNNLEHGVLQFEYTVNRTVSTLYWDLSLIDGTTNDVPGNIFEGENVTITPTGDIQDIDCKQVQCPPADFNTACKMAYWFSTDDRQAMRSCPLSTGDLLMDLCGSVRPFTPYTPPKGPGSKKRRNRFNIFYRSE